MSNPLSLDDLFEAQLKSTSAASAATPEDIADASESTSPADPVDIDHEDEADDVDTDRPELDPESDSEDDDDAELTPPAPLSLTWACRATCYAPSPTWVLLAPPTFSVRRSRCCWKAATSSA